MDGEEGMIDSQIWSRTSRRTNAAAALVPNTSHASVKRNAGCSRNRFRAIPARSTPILQSSARSQGLVEQDL